MMSAAIGVTKPAAGAIATRPATAPEMPPSTVGLPRRSHSIANHESAAAALAKCVATNALVARLEALSALPALKPNQPTHKRHAPIKESVRLCGRIGCCG